MIPIKHTLSRILANFMSFLMITTNVIVPTYSLSSLAAVTIVSNPALGPGCGINVALVLDASGSIDNSEQNQLRSAVNGFITALQGSGSKIAIVEFGTNADTPVPYTEDTVANASVFSNYLSTSNLAGPQYHDGRVGSSTNWEAGMRQVNALPTPPDLVVVVTDGVPNARGVPGVTNQSQQVAADAAALEANITKLNAGNNGAGSHILTIGVGMLEQDLPYMFQLTDGASSAIYDGSNFATADHVNSASFGNLLSDLTNISAKLCNSSVTVTKMVDESGAGSYAPAANWNFAADVTMSAGTYTWVSPTQGGAGPTQGTTGADGQLFFQWNPSNITALSTIQISETQQSGYEFVDVTCTLNGQPITVPQGETFSISNIPLKGFVNCIVRNKKAAGSITIIKAASPSDSTSFAFTAVGSGVSNFSLVPSSNNAKTFTNLSNGNYSFTESNTSGWSLDTLSCSGGSNISTSVASRTATIGLSAGENVICTFGNVKNGTIIVKKVTNPSGRPQSFSFTGNAAGSISDGQTIVVNNLKPGQYTSTEALAANFNLSSIVCDDAASATPSSGNINTRTATFNVDPGETITCTFTNTLVQQAASIVTTIHNSVHNAITSGLPGITVHDSAVVSGGSLGTPTGDVTFSFYNNSTCSGAAVATSSPQALNGSGSVDATAFPQGPLNAGSYSFQARYNGDVNYTPVTSACSPLTINQNDVSLATQLKLASDNSNLGSQISTGTTIYNTAALSGMTPSAGGSVTYTTYTDASCSAVDATHAPSTVTVTNGIVPKSSDATFNVAGTFYFKAAYSGDTNNKSATSSCTSVQVVAPNLALTNVADAATVTPGSNIGYVITVTNNGQGTATNTTMTDNLPQLSGFNWTIDLAQSDSGCTLALDTLSCNFGNMAPGASKQVHVTSATNSDQTMCGSHDNYASAQANNNAQVSVGPVGININCSQGLSLSKSALPTSYDTKGQSITYTYTIRNSGNVDIGPSQFSVSDDKIDGGASFNCGAANTTLAPNATLTCTHTYAITQADLDAGILTNTATATAPGAPTTAPAQATITAVQAKRLSIAKSVPVQQMTYDTLGQQITYTYVVTNIGNVTVGPSQFKVSDDKINNGAEFNCGGAATTLAPAASVTCTAVYAITQADLDSGSVTNIAIASGGGAIPSTPAQVTINAMRNPKLALDKTTTATGYNAVGNVLTYDYLLTNTGNVTLSGPFVVGDDRTSVTCPNTAALAPDQSIHCGATYVIKQSDLDAGTVTNIASGEASFNLLPVVSNSDSVTVLAQQSRELGIAKSAFPTTYSTLNQVITYTYVITNTGNVTLGPDQFKVSDDKINAGAEFVCQSATLAPNATVTCTHTYAITQADLDAGSVTNTATASGAGVGPSAPAQATITAVQAKRLSIAKSVPAEQMTYDTLGQQITYTYVVTNIGNVTVGPSQFKISDDKINNGAEFNCGGGATTLAPTASVTCTAVYAITQADLDSGSVTNIAIASGGGAIPSTPAQVTINAMRNPKLALDKTTTATGYNAVGNVLTYDYLLTNTGNVTLSGPFVVGDDKTTVTCPNTATLSPGQSIHCGATYLVNQADLDAGSVTNIASGEASFNLMRVVSNSDSVTVSAQQSRALGIAKSAFPTTYSTLNQVITYTYVITNTGNVTLGPDQFKVSDDKINAGAEFVCQSATLAPNATVTCTHTYAITQADLDAGSVTNTATASGAGVGQSAPAQATVTATRGPALALDKRTSTSSYQAVGDVLSYSYVLLNSGNVTLSGPFTVDDDKTTVNCPNTATLAPTQSITCSATYAATQDDLDAGSVTNVASGRASFDNAPVVSNTDSVTINAQQESRLSIAKSVAPEQMTYSILGEQITYNYVVTNTGNISVGPTQFTVSDNRINNGAAFNCGAPVKLLPNASVNCTGLYTITQADLDVGSVTNIATGSGGGVGPSAPAEVTINAAQNPLLALDKTTITNSFENVDDVLSYSYVLTNTGNVTLSGPFTVDDDKTTVTCPVAATLAPLASITCSATYTVTQADLDAGSVTNNATGHGSFNQSPVHSNPDSVTIDANQSRGLSVEKSASSMSYDHDGQVITYTYVIKNTGNVTIGPDQFTVNDDKINGGAALDCGPAATTLAPQATVTCSHDYEITLSDMDAGSVTNIATASGGGVGPSAEDSVTIQAIKRPGLNIGKSASPMLYNQVGQIITYTYVITNSGNVTIGPDQLKVSDDKINGGAPFDCPQGPSTLAPNATATCTHEYVITQADLDAGSVTNYATASGGGVGPSAPAHVTIFAEQNALLLLDKATETATYAQVDDVISYTYLLQNMGNVTLSGPFVVGDDRTTVTCPSVALLAPTQSITCLATYVVRQADIDAGSVTNIASGEGHFNLQPVVSNPDSVTVNATQTKSMSITKTDDLNPGTYNHVGQVINFTITATNTGNFTLRNVNVTDDPALDNYSCTPAIPAATLAPGASIECKGSYSITQNDLSVGEVTDVATATSDDITEPVTATDTLYVGLGKLTLVDETIADNGGDLNAASWTMTASGTSILTGQGTVAGHVIDGNYVLSQEVAAGFASSISCTDAQGNAVGNGNVVAVSVGADITCVFRNDDVAPRLTLVKLVTNKHRRTAQPEDWRLNAVGARVDATNLSGQTPVQSGANFKADIYSLSETGPQHYTAEGITCVDDNNNAIAVINGNQIQLRLGQRATCAFASVDDIIPNLVVDPGCNCDATGSGTPSTSNFLMMGLLLGLSMMWRRRRKMN